MTADAPAGDCPAGRPTARIVNVGQGPRAYCPRCQQWQPAAQVPWGKERRDRAGRITASYALLPHSPGDVAAAFIALQPEALRERCRG